MATASGCKSPNPWSVEYDDGGKRRERSFNKEEAAERFRGGLVAAVVKRYLTKSWLFRFMIDGKADNMGLGAVDVTTLATARARAQKARELLHEGINPRGVRNAKRAERKLDAARAVSFREAAEAYIKAHRAGWRNAVHARQWISTFNETRHGDRVYPAATAAINDLPVSAIDTGLILKVIEPLWSLTPETASRTRGRIELVLDFAKVRGLREGENPARWRGHLDKLLPARARVRRVKHHHAMEYAKLPAFMSALRAREGAVARCLEFAILTATRAGEAIGARWAEIDLRQRLWVVPGERMKSGKEHRVALGDRALAILKERLHGGELLFPGVRGGQLLATIREMGEAEPTTHGFRSSFRDWAAEQTSYASELCELALAHRVGSAVENAYRRGDQMEKRRRLMQDWARFLESPPTERGEVVPIRASAS